MFPLDRCLFVSQIYVQSRSFFVSYCHINENYYKSVTSTTFNTNYPECVRKGRGRGFGGGGGGGVERKWKREAEKGDNEGRETQIG